MCLLFHASLSCTGRADSLVLRLLAEKQWRLLKGGLLLLIFFGLSGCSSMKDEENKPLGIAGFVVHPPTSEDDWRAVRTEFSQFFITTRDKQYDEDMIALFVEIVPIMRPVANEQELLQYIRGHSDEGRLPEIAADTLLGKDVVRFHGKIERAENPARFLQLLKLQPRVADATYTKNSKGILFCHPENNTLAIRVGIWRNSYHGQIGDYFEKIAADFASSFLAANGMIGKLE